MAVNISTAKVERKAVSLTKRRDHKIIMKRIAAISSCIAVFIVTYILISPALTVEWPPVCGIEEHTHTEECYETREVTTETLSCEVEGTVAHTHNEFCYNSDDELICTLPELEPHTHTDACYTFVEGHTHTDECYETTEAHVHTDECYTMSEPQLICGLEECEADPGHTHTDECYETTPSNLVCEIAEHTHSEECYDEDGNLICELEEHTHDDSCYSGETITLVCGEEAREPSEGHTHTADCYSEAEQVLTCGLEEGESGKVLICELEESEGGQELTCGLEETTGEHEHTADCVSTATVEEQVLICGKEEHTHTDLCRVPEKTSYCGFNAHTHNTSCYDEEGNLICELTEHTHLLQCYSNPNADVETEDVWFKTMDDVELTGNYSEDLVAIANTQIGYKESEDNYITVTDEYGNESIAGGYTRYGAWYGLPYDDWDTMFVSFCLNYAGIDSETVPYESSLDKWIETLNEQELYIAIDPAEWKAEEGNIIFFDDYDETIDELPDGIADRVGIVTEIGYDKMKVVEGDSDDKVAENIYDLNDEHIIGYVELPVNETLETADETDTAETTTLTCEGSDYTVTVTYGEEAELPENVELRAVEYDKGSDEYKGYYKELVKHNGWDEDTDYSADVRLFDIGFYDEEGNEVEPKANVQVSITYDGASSAGDIQITHFADAGTETLESVTTISEDGKQTAEFVTDSFSFFARTDKRLGETYAAYAGNTSTTDQYGYLVGVASAGNKSTVGGVAFYIAWNSKETGESVDNWTSALHIATMYGSKDCQDALKKYANYDNWIALGDNDVSGNQAAAYDEQIRKAVAENTLSVKVKNDVYKIKMVDFPDDETILAELRNQKTTIEVGGKGYNTSDITSENFEIKWIVVKHLGDGWHVDGILVRKNASLTVTKTFIGDEDAIAAAKNNFKITVTEVTDEDENETTVKELKLTDEGALQDNGTYKWVITGLSGGKDYTVTESGYEATVGGTEYIVSTSYAVTKSPSSANDTTGYGETATAKDVKSYLDNVDSDSYQTVAFTNVYTRPYTLTILKQDGTTYNPLKNVKFDLEVTRTDGTGESTTETITTNEKGIATFDFSQLSEGEGKYDFTLTEKENQGYEALPVVSGKVTVAEGGKITISDLVGGVYGDNTLVNIDKNTQATIYVVNKSERVEVTVKKTWEVENENEKLPVTVKLLRNGTEVAGTEQVLNSGNEWTVTWSDLPLYVDGEVVDYTVRETWIGEADSGGKSYNPAVDSTDGYADYIVTQSTVSGSRTETDDDGTKHTVYTSTVSLTNCPDKGQVVITKIDSDTKAPLFGAEFTVYSDKECTTKAIDTTFTSGTDGNVTISGLTAGTTYYVKETKAPNGYALSDTVYVLNAQDRNSTIKTLNGEAVTTITNVKMSVNLKITKINSSTGAALPGATFILYQKDSNDNTTYYKYNNETTTWVSNQSDATHLTSGSDGTFNINNLPTGTYYLEEIEAPDGYVPLTYKFIIEVGETGVTYAGEGGAEKTKTVEKNTDGTYTFNVPNDAGVSLPSTGTTFTPTTLLHITAVLMAVIAGVSWIAYFSEKRKERRGRVDEM